jgi:imidazolonepropionase-like amidohydrolase
VNVRPACLLLLAALAAACGMTAPEAPPPAGRATALVGGRVQPSPDGPAIPDGVVIVENGRIAAVGARRDIAVPRDAMILDCAGATVSAGFWNAHVHFTESVWSSADTAPADRLAGALQTMLTSWGFATVMDTGSIPSVNFPLRRRIENGEVEGPRILIASGGIVPVGGSPFYLLPLRLFEAARPEDAAARVEAVAALGAEAIKLFTGSYASPNTIVVMPVEVVRGAVEAAHRHGKLVIAHPSDSRGARAALEGGVDILAHTFPSEAAGPWDRTLPARMVERRMAMIPTLKIWPWELTRLRLPPAIVERVLENGEAQVRAFAEAGGQVLFGTDVGYMTDYDPTDEYLFLQRAGLSYAGILATLTTAPSERFGLAARTGRLARGLDADITVVDGDPAHDIRALSRVRYTIRAGRVIYRRG